MVFPFHHVWSGLRLALFVLQCGLISLLTMATIYLDKGDVVREYREVIEIDINLFYGIIAFLCFLYLLHIFLSGLMLWFFEVVGELI